MTDRLLRAFTEHPASVGESYWRHLAFALGFAARLILAGLAALVHALLPFLFKTTASRMIAEMAARTGTRTALAGRSADRVAADRNADVSLGRV